MLELNKKINYNGSTNLRFDIENFTDNESEFVEKITSAVSENIASMVEKAINVLIPFTKQIFGNEYDEKDGYFDFDEIEISDSANLPYSRELHYELSFALDSTQGYVMDYCTYFVIFDSKFVLTSVFRM